MIYRPHLLTALIAATALLPVGCAVAPPINPQEAQIQEDLAVDNFMPATRQMRDAIETQELFAQAAFWSNEYTLNPSDLEAAIKLSAAVRKLGNPGRAIEITQHTRALYPRDPYLLAEYGAALVASERSADAIPILDQGLATTPGYGRLWSLKGAALDQQERYAEARQNYDRALRITPNDPNVMANLGLSFALSGDLVTAETWLRRAAAMPNASNSVRQNLVLVLQLQGKTDESQKVAGMIRPEMAFPQMRPAHNVSPTRQKTITPNPQSQVFPQARLQTGPVAGQQFTSASDAARSVAVRQNAQQQAPASYIKPTQTNAQTFADPSVQKQTQGYPTPNYGQENQQPQPQRREPSRRRR